MKFVNFKKIILSNFLSIGSEPVEIEFKKGLNIITGTNKDKEDRRNGVGKSAIADAIFFGVFGSTLRDIKKDFISNNLINDGAKVQIQLNVDDGQTIKEIEIERTLNPSKVFITVDGEDKTLDSISNTNNFIEKLLSTNQEIFKNCIILTINNTIPFMGMKKQDKRKFIECIFNLEIFSKMSELLKGDISDVRNSYSVETNKLNELENNRKTFTTQSINFEDERKARLEKYTNRQNNNTKELEELEQFFNKYENRSALPLQEQLDSIFQNISKVEEKSDEYTTNIASVKSEINYLKERANTIGTDKDKCPVCLKSVDALDKEHIKQELNALVSQINEKNSTLVTFSKELDQFKNAGKYLLKQSKQINKKIQNVAVEESEFRNKVLRKKQLEEWLTTLKEDIESVREDKNGFVEILKETETKINDTNDRLEKIKNVSKILESVKFVVSEEGVKSYIIKKILELFNNKINIYLNKLDSNCSLLFDEYFEEKIINDKGVESCYNNFSGAEKKAIDLACMFSFMDIRRLQGDVAYNLCLFDELFDCSFDEKGVELVLDTLKERIEAYGESCYIISHRKESIKAATGEIVNLEKCNGVTQRVAFKEE